MKRLQCDVCGGQIEIQADGLRGVCLNCGAAYSIGRMRNMLDGLKVSVTSSQEDINQWKELLHRYYNAGDFQEAEKIVKKILEAAPNDAEASQYYEELQTLKYMEVKNGVLVKYTGFKERVAIPNCVTQIGDAKGNGVLHNQEAVKYIYIPNSVKVISNHAFGKNAFEEIQLPNSIIEIGDHAFWGSKKLRRIKIPESVRTIGSYAFSDCEALECIIIPESVESIGAYAFESCIKLESVTIPDRFVNDDVFRYNRLSDYSHPCPWYLKLIGEDKETKQQRESWRRSGRCQYCGGEFGLFSSKCKTCGKFKDY